MKQLRKSLGVMLLLFITLAILPVEAQGVANKEPEKISANKSTNLVPMISRIKGKNRYETAAMISKAMMPHSDIVVLASGQNYPDALAGVAYAAEINAPILLTPPKSLSPFTLAEIHRLGATKVYILGGNEAISQSVENQMIAADLTTFRIKGTNRYRTAVEIGDRMARTNKEVFLASGVEFADAISVGSAAAKFKTPVLLTNSAGLNPATQEALIRWGTTKVIILGGTGAISQTVEDSLLAMNLSVERIGGSTRYETNYQINQKYYTNPTKIFIASGEKYPDALTGALLANFFNTTIVLTKMDMVTPSLTTYLMENPIQEVTIFGGSLAVSDQVMTSIETLLNASAPVIELLGSNPASVPLHSKAYADSGAYAFDQLDGDISSLVTSISTVNLGATGTYQVAYSITNSLGKTNTATRMVNVVDRLNPETISKFQTEMLVPEAMPKSPGSNATRDYYEIAMRQFQQQMLPPGLPKTTVWGYGSVTDPNAVFNAPSLTIEAETDKPVRIKWVNDLIDANGNYLPHLLPIDQNLHWANPAGPMTDMEGSSALSYVGPVPMVTHLHGSHATQESDGYPEAWYLPDAKNISSTYHRAGTFYNQYKATAQSGHLWQNGSAIFDYANDQKPATLWYHDHTLGMTRTNVYTGPAGFYLIRDPGGDKVYADALRLTAGLLPGGAQEIPIAIQDRSFNEDGSLFYPDSREFFDGFTGPYLPDESSDIAPMWNPEFFGDTLIANGSTWPYQVVEQKQYRLRFLNGSQSRTLILKLSDGSPLWMIGTDAGFMETPVSLPQLILGPAERADVIVDFSMIPEGTTIILKNLGPDSPFGDLEEVIPANPLTTGQVLQFRVVAATTPDSIRQLPN